MFEGLMSVPRVSMVYECYEERLTSVYDLPAVEIRQTMQDALSNLAKNLLACSAPELLDFSVDRV